MKHHPTQFLRRCRRHCAGAAAVSKAALAALPEPVIQTTPDTMPPLVPHTGRPYNPVVTLNGWTLPWRMNDGVKEFHLVAEPVVREMAPGMKAQPVGLQRPEPGADDRGGRRRPRAHLRHQQAAGAHHHPLARPAPAQRHGRRRRPDPAADPARQDLRLRVRRAPRPAPSCTTRTPTRWCRWRWA